MGMVLGMRVAIRPISAMMMSRALASTRKKALTKLVSCTSCAGALTLIR